MEEEEESQAISSPQLMESSPLCVFYFTHPCSVGGGNVTSYRGYDKHLPSEKEETTPHDADRRPGYLTKRRTPGRATWRRRLRQPPRDLNSFLFANRIGGSVIDLDVVLDTIREAWVPHRSYSSLDRDLHKSSLFDLPSSPPSAMGTGGRMTRNDRGRPATQVLAGLPHRRYSVPETIMRKYNLTKQHSDSNSDGTVTVPNLTPENMGVSSTKSGVGNASTPRGGRTPPGDRRRKTGRGFDENTFRRPARTNVQPRVRKNPPMYKGAKGNQESASDESEEKVQEVKVPLNNNIDSTSEEVKSPDCVECKNFLLEVIAEESEKAALKESKSPKSSVGKSDVPLDKDGKNNNSVLSSTKHLSINKAIDEDEIIAEVLLKAERNPCLRDISQETIDSPGSSSIPIEDIDDGYSQKLQNKIPSQRNSPRTSSETERSEQVSTPEEIQSSPTNEDHQQSNNVSSPRSEGRMLDRSSASESSIEKTSGFSDQTTPEERDGTTPGGVDDEVNGSTPREVQEASPQSVPPLNLGSVSNSISPNSTPMSSDRPSGGSSFVNDRTSSVTLYQPNTDRSSSTQDSTMSIPSDSLPRSQAMSNSPRDGDVMTQSTQTQSEQKHTSETTATNTDTPVAMATTATNTEQCGCTDVSRTDAASSPQADDEAENQSLPVDIETEELHQPISCSPQNIEEDRNEDLPIESNFCGIKSDLNPLKSPEMVLDDLQQTYPINRPFSMSKSTEEKYAKVDRISESRSSEPPRSELVFSSESHYTEERESNTPWAENFDEDEYTKLAHQRQRYWMSKRTDVSLPMTPGAGALSAVGAGTVYRKNNVDAQLAVPRYSALPRTVSMLVNTSSQDCSSNSSDSECLSLVDSLDEVPISPKHYRAQDVVELLPEGQKIIAKPREKSKTFFIAMDEPTEVTTASSPIVAELLPEKLKKRLSSRHEVINMKRMQQVEAREQKEKEAKEREAKEQKAKIAKARRELKAKKAEKKLPKGRSRSNESSPRDAENKEDEKQLRKSSIPVKSPNDLQKLVSSPRSNLPGSSQKTSQLPVRRRHQSSPIRRSANLLNRFQQRFEVIPEERSGSLDSSLDESRLMDRARSVSLPTSKLTSQLESADVKSENTSPRSPMDNPSPREGNTPRSQRRSDGASKRTPRPIRVLKTDGPLIESVVIQEVDDLEEPVKDYYKGRAALAPHTDEGMSSLSKGWINFYLLKDGGKSSPETSGADAGGKSNVSPVKTVNVGGSGNRIRTYTVPYNGQTSKTTPPLPTLPELKPVAASRKQSVASDERQYDSNSSDGKRITTYLHLPSPRVQPPYLFEGSEEQASSESSSVTSSEEETERSISPAMLPVRWPIRQQHRRLPSNQRTKSQHYRPEAGQHPRQTSANVGVGWTVTVAGNNNQTQPDVEMRLTFPPNARRQPNSQSDSGLGEDNNNNKNNLEESRPSKKHFLPPASATQGQARWTLTVKNAPERVVQDFRAEKTLFQCLPELPHQPGQTKSSKKANKGMTLPATTLGDHYHHQSRHLSAVWPRDEGLITTRVVIRKSTARYSREVKSVSQMMADTEEGLILRSGLAVTGSAISPEKKPRVQTMSEKDLTRGHIIRR